MRPRSEPKIACIWVNWSDDAVVATSDDSPIGMPYSRAVTAGAQPWPIWISICGANETFPPESRTSAHSSSVKCEAWTYVVFGIEQVHVAQRRDLHLRVPEAVHRDVDRDVDVELLGQLPVVADDVGLAEVGPRVASPMVIAAVVAS